ncbi:MAG: sulfatase [Planctomycetota bacterium]|nr:sulfatase [Planctomycetota bacterium]
MERGIEERRAVLTGWALGAFEAGCVLTDTGHLGSPSLFFLVPLSALCFYGLIAWVVAAVLGSQGKRLPWKWLYWFGLAGLIFLLRRRGLPVTSHLSFVGLGGIASLALWFLSIRPEPPRAAIWLGKFNALAPFLIWLGLHLALEKPREGDGPTQEVKSEKNVVLVTWDTVRADSLPLYGGAGLDTPNLERLATAGVVVRDFQAVASITAPSHMSMLTGMYPPSHGLRSNGLTAPETGIQNLPQQLRDAGWHTGAFVSALPVHAKFGFARGFEYFDQRPESSAGQQFAQIMRFSSSIARLFLPESLRGTLSVQGATTVSRATDWYKKQSGPTFMWVHLFDAHGPYDPPEAYRKRAIARKAEGPHAVSPEDEEALVLQRGEIELLDDLLGELLASLSEKDPELANTAVIVVADHGECFGEGGIHLEHETSLYSATQHVPAILTFPGSELTTQPTLASHVDLAPTIMGFAGLESISDFQGDNLLSPEDRTLTRGLYMEAYQERLGEDRMEGWVEGDWKFVRNLKGEEFLYRRSLGETNNFASKEPEVLATMRGKLESFLESIVVRTGAAGELSSSEEAAMQGLGYFEDDE